MAKCESCGAALLDDRIVCSYCGARNQIDLKSIGGWTVTDPNSRRECPCCNQELTTVAIKSEKKLHIEKRDRCGGLFFDPGELPYLLETSVDNVFELNKTFLSKQSEAYQVTRRKRHYIPCPVCKTLMNAMSYGTRSGVIIDWCRPHGIWLDGGELRRLLEWAKAGGLLQSESRPFHILSQKQNPATRRLNVNHTSECDEKEYTTDPGDNMHLDSDLLGGWIDGLFKFLNRG